MRALAAFCRPHFPKPLTAALMVTCGRVSVMLGKEESAVCDRTLRFTTACNVARLCLRHTLAECS